MGTEVLRPLERVVEMAAASALREVRRDDRAALGRHRGLQQAGEQGFSRVRGRAEQQNPGHPEKGIRPAGRGIPSAENPDLHAQGDMNLPTQLREDPFFNSINLDLSTH